MENAAHALGPIRFGTFEVDLRAGELRKNGVKLKLSGQPFQVLTILLERPGEVVTREQLQKRLWPDTFVDVDHNLNTAINKIREVLGDSSDSPRFVETLPRRGYRFIATLTVSAELENVGTLPRPLTDRHRPLSSWAFAAILITVGAAGALFFLRERGRQHDVPAMRMLTRITFAPGLQIGATWSPDNRSIAYSSNQGGKFDLWVQQLSDSAPIQITHGSGQNWQPNWSPDGKLLAYRSEGGGGGLFIIPAAGGMERRISPFGYYPQWSPDGSQILFQGNSYGGLTCLYLANMSGTGPTNILCDFFSRHRFTGRSARWYPDGKRVSVWANGPGGPPSLWTLSLDGKTEIHTEIVPEIVEQFKSAGYGGVEFNADSQFSWDPSGKKIYFERTLNGATNLWALTVDHATLRATAMERVTTGPGPDAQFSLSPDGTKVVFTGETRRVSVWWGPLDARTGKMMAAGEAVTSASLDAWSMSVTADGKKLAFTGSRGGKWGIWQKTLPDGQEEAIGGDDYFLRAWGLWSPDGNRLAYFRFNPKTQEVALMIWSGDTKDEEQIATGDLGLYGWSPDGNSLVVSSWSKDTGKAEVAVLPISAKPHAESAAQIVARDPKYYLFQPQISPDGRWIIFEAVHDGQNNRESSLFVIPRDGGNWIRITDGVQWDDKPRWSQDGRMIYFVSGKDGVYNVWASHFDPLTGKIIGGPFKVTNFSGPDFMIPTLISNVGLAIVPNHLAVTVSQSSGGIWVLGNVDR